MTTPYFLITLLISIVLTGYSEIVPAATLTKSEKETSQKMKVEKLPISSEIFVEAALNGNLKIIEQALEEGYKVDARDRNQRTALMYAAFNGHTAVVKKLIDAKADVNAQDSMGSTALMFSSSGPFSETIQLLLERGAKINTVDRNEHFSALMWAAAEGQVEVVKLLLKHGADLSLKDVDGDTAESFATQKNHTDVVKILQAATLKLKVKNPVPLESQSKERTVNKVN